MKLASIDRKLNWKNKAETEEDNKDDDDQVKLLVSAWDNLLLNNEDFFKKLGMNKSDIPNAPHLENCEERTRVRERLDTQIANQTYPPWVCFSLSSSSSKLAMTKRMIKRLFVSDQWRR